VSSAEVAVESERGQLNLPLRTARTHPGRQNCQRICDEKSRSSRVPRNNASAASVSKRLPSSVTSRVSNPTGCAAEITRSAWASGALRSWWIRLELSPAASDFANQRILARGSQETVCGGAEQVNPAAAS